MQTKQTTKTKQEIHTHRDSSSKTPTHHVLTFVPTISQTTAKICQFGRKTWQSRDISSPLHTLAHARTLLEHMQRNYCVAFFKATGEKVSVAYSVLQHKHTHTHRLTWICHYRVSLLIVDTGLLTFTATTIGSNVDLIYQVNFDLLEFCSVLYVGYGTVGRRKSNWRPHVKDWAPISARHLLFIHILTMKIVNYLIFR